MTKWYHFNLSILLSAVLFPPISSIAQVSIAPTTLFTNVNGISTCYITNPSNTPQEIDLSFVFGYPDYDEAGYLNMVYQDSIKEAIMGIGDRLRAFPRSFTLQPFQQQVVRIQVRPDRNKPDGMYFTRLKISSKALSAELGSPLENEISSQVNFRFDQIIAVFSRQGSVSTSLSLGDIHYERVGNQVHVISDFKREGNSPFLGTAHVRLKDPQNQVVTEQRQSVALYFDSKHRISLNLPDNFAPGDFDLEITYSTQRNDINSSDLVQADPVTRLFPVKIPFLGDKP